MAGAIRRVALAAAVAAAVPAMATAHSTMVATDPPSGAVLERSPARVVVTYAEPLGAVSAAEVRVAGRNLAGEAHLDTGDRRRLVIPLGGAAGGAHRASWVVVAADGHPMGGELTFRVRPPAVTRVLHRAGRSARLAGVALARAASSAGAGDAHARP